MEFLAYSDIHHDEYKNGILEDDIYNIENEITNYAINNNINTIIFAGDWFRATNPTREIIARAEDSWKFRNDNNIHTYVLVGNHDRWTKSAISGHAYVSTNIFKNDLSNIFVYDTVSLVNIQDGYILFVPSGHENLLKPLNKKYNNLGVIFHGLVNGSSLVGGSYVSDDINPELLKSINASFILGGDNHTTQRLDDILECPSLYLGAPLQHNWGDSGQDRGFWHIKCNNDIVEFKFIHTNSPKFIKFIIDSGLDINKQIDDKLLNLICPIILDIIITGSNVDSINSDKIETYIRNTYNIRRLKIIVDKNIEKIRLLPGSSIMTHEEKWDLYISNIDNNKLKNINTVYVSNMGKWLIQEARSRQ